MEKIVYEAFISILTKPITLSGERIDSLPAYGIYEPLIRETIKHEHIVYMYEWFEPENEDFFILISEYVPYGSIDDYLIVNVSL
jgi:serine/threonine protein kinase